VRAVFRNLGYDMHMASVSRQWKGIIDIDPVISHLWEKEKGQHFSAMGVAQKVSLLNHVLFGMPHRAGWANAPLTSNIALVLPRPSLFPPLKDRVMSFAPGKKAKCSVVLAGKVVPTTVTREHPVPVESSEVVELRRRLAEAEKKLDTFKFKAIMDDGTDDSPLVPYQSPLLSPPPSTFIFGPDIFSPLIPVPSPSPGVCAPLPSPISPSTSLLDVKMTQVVSSTTTTTHSTRPAPPQRVVSRSPTPVVNLTGSLVLDERDRDRAELLVMHGGERPYQPDNGRIDWQQGCVPEMRGGNMITRDFLRDDPVAQQIIRFLHDHPGARPDEIRYCLKGQAASVVVLFLHKMAQTGVIRYKKDGAYNYWWVSEPCTD